LSLAGLALFAFAVCFFSGLRGIFPLDQSIVFDGAYRVFRGQVIYRDFIAPYGPIAFWWQALLFEFVGVNYYAYALGAATLNVAGSLCAFEIVRGLFPDRPWLAVGAGALTAVWLYAPFGTTYPEQTAFCLLIAALALIVRLGGRGSRREDSGSAGASPSRRAVHDGQRLGGSLALPAGILSATAVLAKHNAGLPALGVCVAAIVVFSAPAWKRVAAQLVWFFIGAGVCLAAFVAWVWACSDWTAFHYHVIELPRQLGSQRLFGCGLAAFLRGLLTGKGSDEVRILLFLGWLLSACVVWLAFVNRRRVDSRDVRALRAAVSAILLTGFQNIFSLVSSNDGTNEKPFLGVIFALNAGLIGYLWTKQPAAGSTPADDAPWRQLPRWPLWALPALAAGLSLWLHNGIPIAGTLLAALVTDSLGCFRAPAAGSWEDRIRRPLPPVLIRAGLRAAFAYLLIVGGIVSLARQVHESFEHHRHVPHVFVFSHHSTFNEVFDEPALGGLRWGEPTKVGERAVTAGDMRKLLAHLRERGGNFFTFPDFTFLYAALNVTPPQPLLWFHSGLTYAVDYSPELDLRVVRALKDNDVRTIVLEEDNFLRRTHLEDFPELRSFIEQRFDLDRRIGIFSVYHRANYRDPLMTDGIVTNSGADRK
jgi:hypothetical protein